MKTKDQPLMSSKRIGLIYQNKELSCVQIKCLIFSWKLIHLLFLSYAYHKYVQNSVTAVKRSFQSVSVSSVSYSLNQKKKRTANIQLFKRKHEGYKINYANRSGPGGSLFRDGKCDCGSNIPKNRRRRERNTPFKVDVQELRDVSTVLPQRLSSPHPPRAL